MQNPTMSLESIEALRVFAQVVESGGFSAAGRVVDLSPTLVSRRIARLEDELGVRLFQRTTRRMHITDEGRRFYARCLRVLDELDAAAEELRPDPTKVKGTVRAVLPTVVASMGVMDGIRDLLDAHPELDLQLSFSDHPVDLIGGGWDVAAHIGAPPVSSHAARHLVDVTPWLVATPEYLARAGIPETPEELADHDCLLFVDERPARAWTLVGPDGVRRDFPVGGRLAIDNSAALGNAAYAGLGIGVRAPGEVLRAEARGLLVRVLPGWHMAALPLYSLVPAGRRKVPRIRAFVAFLAREMKGLASAPGDDAPR